MSGIRLVSPIKYPGGKSYLAARIVQLMPEHQHFVEPFFGGGAVLFAKGRLKPCASEVANDVWASLVNFWRVLQDPQTFAAFLRTVQAMPFSQFEWENAEAHQPCTSALDVPAAVAFFVRGQQSRAGEFKEFTTLSRSRTRRRQEEHVSAWWSSVERLPAVHNRLRPIVILNDDAINVIRDHDTPETLFYLDPPYLHSTRTNADRYVHEMTAHAHRRLLETIKLCRGMVLLSGYPNELYDEQLTGWDRREFEIDNKSAGGKTKRKQTEYVWMNFKAPTT